MPREQPPAFDPGVHVATAHNKPADVVRLLEIGYSAKARDYEGRTALHIAATNGFTACAKVLIQHGAEVNALDRDGKTPLLLAPKDNAELQELLKTSGAIDSEKYFQCEQPNQVPEKEEVSEEVSKPFLRLAFIVFLLPFVVLLFVNGIFFALKFIAFTCTFYFVCLGYFVSEITLKPPWYHHRPGEKSLTLKALPDYWDAIHDPKHDLGLDYEDVSFPSVGGYMLSAWYIPCKRDNASKMGLVFAHGNGRDRRAWLRHVPMFNEAGYSCLLFDFREHGLSTGAKRGSTCGMGERHDVVAAEKFMRSKGGFERIAAIGTSIGASSVIMAAAIDKDINVIVAENPIMTCAHLQDKHLVNIFSGYFHGSWWGRFIFKVFRYACSNWLNWRIGNKPSRRCQALHVVGKLAPRPILLMHGTYDDVVPPYHSERLFEFAQEPKELWLAPEAIHCGLQNKHPEEFKKRVLTFLRKFEH